MNFTNASALYENYKENSQHAAPKIAWVLRDREKRVFEHDAGFRVRNLRDNLMTLLLTVSTYPNNFIFPLIDEFVTRTYRSGIPQYLFEYHKWLKLKNFRVEDEDERVVLTMDILGFGFVIFLCACGVSTVVFFIELTWLKWRRLGRKCVGLLLFLVLLFERLGRRRGWI
jgi:hypothetical protein